MAKNSIRIAVLSGKGGAGKTLVSVNLAAAAEKAAYIDCDIEEPNGHLFFKPKPVLFKTITVKYPQLEDSLCNGCRQCVDFCQFNALAYSSQKIMIFPEICHACGGCILLCPEKALSEQDRVIGELQIGISESVDVFTGILNPGEASGVPIIRRLLSKSIDQEYVFVDCPPGSACTVMESIRDADYCILVAEPTLFGVHNLSMVHELVKLLAKPHGAILNKDLAGENPAEKYCLENGIEILGRIPLDSELGKMNSNAQIAARENIKYHDLFMRLLNNLIKEVGHETAVNSQR